MTPIAIPLHRGGGKLRNNTEVRFVLRSIEKHFKGEFTVAFVTGKMPDWATGIEHVPDGGSGLKTALVKAAEAFPEGFFWWYDDSVLLKDQTPEELRVTMACRKWGGPRSGWSRKLDSIKDRLEKEGFQAWDYSRPHGPYWFTKEMIDEAFEDWPGMAGKFPFESWILSKKDWPRRHVPYKQYYGRFNREPNDHELFVNFNHNGFTQELHDWLKERFPEDSRFECEPPKVEVIEKLNAVVFSLYGDNPTYAAGLIQNMPLMARYYPGWQMVAHVEEGHYATPRLRNAGVEVIEHQAAPDHAGMKWRFLTGDDTKYNHTVFRDADSRLNPREAAAVNEWLSEDTDLHVMRDHRLHRKTIMGGAWGIRNGAVNLGEIMAGWRGTGGYGDDEAMLAAKVWPELNDSVTVHSRAPKGGECRFPDHEPWTGHVGERVEPSLDPAKTRLVLLSVDRYHQRRARFMQSFQQNGGLLQRLNLEWWKATPHTRMLAPPSFRKARKEVHWWAASCDHLRIYEETLLGGWDTLFLFEDDAVFADNFDVVFWKAWCALPPGWKGLRLGWHDWPGKQEIVPGILDRCPGKGGLLMGMMWNRAGLNRFYDHAWHRRKLIIDLAFEDLRIIEPRDWYQPSTPLVTKDPAARQQGMDA